MKTISIVTVDTAPKADDYFGFLPKGGERGVRFFLDAGVRLKKKHTKALRS